MARQHLHVRGTVRKLVAVAAAAGCLSLGVVAAGGGSASAATTPAKPFPAHVTYKVGVMPSASAATRDAAVEKQYDAWKKAYLVKGCASNEYYVSTKGDDDAPNNGTVSEAQGYGMNIVPLMAGYDASAQTEFNGLWQPAKAHEDADGLMQWPLDAAQPRSARTRRIAAPPPGGLPPMPAQWPPR
jgi:hypothetical protein